MSDKLRDRFDETLKTPAAQEIMKTTRQKVMGITMPFSISLGLFVILVALVVYGGERVSVYAMYTGYGVLASVGVFMWVKSFIAKKINETISEGEHNEE